MSFPRYPKYKASGVEWLGEVPAHWELTRLGRVAALNPSKSESHHLERSQLVSFLPMEAVGEDGSLDLSRQRPIGELEAGYTYFRDGDVVVAKITPCFENGKGALMTSLQAGVGFGTSELIVIRPNLDAVRADFLLQVTRSPVFRMRGEAEMYGAGGQKRVPDDFVRGYQMPMPPLQEQGAIAAFLDRETAKIDALVAEQQRLIELLKEKRQAVISHAVTKGLDPNAKMKPSGIEWLGDVPAHWEVTPLMRLTPEDRQIMYGIVLPGPDVDDGVSIVKGGDVSPDRLHPSRLKKTTYEIESGYVRSRLRAGDIVYSIRGSIGEAELVPEEVAGANITQDVARISPMRGLNALWLLLAMRSDGVFSQLDAGASGATIRGVNIFSLKRARIPVPPRQEQDEIAGFISVAASSVDRLAADAQRAVALLQERRTALISAAVTGQIDVRNAGGPTAAS